MEEPESVSAQILAAVLDLKPAVRALQTEVNGTTMHLQQLDRRFDAVGSQLQGYGTEITKLSVTTNGIRDAINDRDKRCAKHSKELDELKRQAENTGKHIIVEGTRHDTKLAFWKRAALVIGMAGGLVGLATAIERWVRPASATPQLSSPKGSTSSAQK